MDDKPTRVPTKRIILTIPAPLLGQLDDAAKSLRFSRTRLIVRSLKRDMSTTLQREVEKTKAYTEVLSKSFGTWE